MPKVDLIGGLRALLDGRRLQWPAALAEAAVLETELRDYRVKVTQALHDSYSARDGAHDDQLLAVAIACWTAQHAYGGVPA